MKRLLRLCVAMIALLLAVPDIVASCSFQSQDTSIPGQSAKIYVIQVAASKVYIDPGFFKEKLRLAEDVRFFRKDGWYKYVFGVWKTENDATQELARLKIEAFVTAVGGNESATVPRPAPVVVKPAGDSLPESGAAPPDTAMQSGKDTPEAQMSESGRRQLYNLKIREADSEFNIAKNLVQARRLYEEASLMAPDKNYPKDQVVEIDQQLMQQGSQSIFSKLNLRFYILAGCAVVLFLVLGSVWIVRTRNQKRIQAEWEDEEKDEEKEKEKEKEKEAGVEVIPEPGAEGLTEPAAFQQIELFPEKTDESGPEHDDLLDKLNSLDVFERIEAELALIRLHPGDPFSFIEHLNQEFTSLEQLLLFEKIKHGQLDIPDFSRWLHSPNPSVVQFCKWMIKAYKQDT